MARPRKIRLVRCSPAATYFKPRGIRLRQLKEVELTFDELESMRLANLEKLGQQEAASRMEIHQSTFQRTLSSAREKVTDAIISGKAIKVSGGDYKMPGGDGRGPAGPRRGFGPGRGRGRMGGPLSAGPGGDCVCPKCGYEKEHFRGRPCNQEKCPKCGTLMTRR